jgi:hypothetical protein
MENDVKCKIKEKREPKQSVNMGEHPAQTPHIVIPRTFRWTLTNESHPEIHWWMKSVKSDYVNKKLLLEVFDDAKGHVFNWIEALVNKNPEACKQLTLTHLDGCGDTISLINFDGLTIEDHVTSYDYGNSEVLTHKLTVFYKNSKRVNNLNIH